MDGLGTRTAMRSTIWVRSILRVVLADLEEQKPNAGRTRSEARSDA